MSISQKKGFQPPRSNTGGKSQAPSRLTKVALIHLCSPSIDWLSGTFSYQDFDLLLDQLGRFFGDHAKNPEYCKPSIGYSHGMNFPCGIRICWRAESLRFFISIPGSALRLLIGGQLSDFFLFLDQIGFSCTRIDCAADFYDGIGCSIDTLWGWCLNGLLANGRKFSMNSGNPIYEPEMVARDFGENVWQKFGCPHRPSPNCRGRCRTLYIGSRGKKGAGYFSRIYEKGRQYGIYSEWIRVETEFTGNCAKEVYRRLSAAFHSGGKISWRDTCASHAFYRIRFLRSSRYGNGSAREVLPRWQSVVGNCLAIRLPPIRSRRAHFLNVHAFIRQYSVFLAKLWRLGGSGFCQVIFGMVSSGLQKLRGRAAPTTNPFLGASCPLIEDFSPEEIKQLAFSYLATL